MSVRDLIILGCSSQQPTRHRNHGGYLLRWNEEGLLFDPGEGTQRQFIYANIAPTCVNRIFISHFHGDHCFGFPSMLLRLNLDKVEHPIHCYYPASGRRYFNNLRNSTLCHETIQIIEHPVDQDGLVHEDEHFRIEAKFLKHGVDCVGWRITEPERRKFDKEKLQSIGIQGLKIKELIEKGFLIHDGEQIALEDVSWIRPGEVIAIVIDTLPCQAAVDLAKNARLLLGESTYLKAEADLAKKYNHMTAEQMASIAKKACAKELILTHYSARYPEVHPFAEEAREIFPNTHAAEDLKVFDLPRMDHEKSG